MKVKKVENGRRKTERSLKPKRLMEMSMLCLYGVNVLPSTQMQSLKDLSAKLVLGKHFSNILKGKLVEFGTTHSG